MGKWAPPRPDIGLAERLFAELRVRTADDIGITRQAYGHGEQVAHDIVQAAAEDLRLEIARDFVGNLYMTLPGQDRTAPQLVIGSHLDSVPRGGNYDGAAGVICGLAALGGLIDESIRPSRDITVMAIRSEEAVWFANNYTGSKMALGQLRPSLLDSLVHFATRRTLAESIAEAGFDPEPVRRGEAYLTAENVATFIEAHIEQGPVLEATGMPIGIVTGIRGNFRYRNCRCLGEYGHSGAVPLSMRHDAVAATAELVCRLNEIWRLLETEEGEDLVFTVGEFFTDPNMHGFSRIAGDVSFTLDVRSHSASVLERMHHEIAAATATVSGRWGVIIELGEIADAPPAVMDETLRREFSAAAVRQNVLFCDIASGGGHDAAQFQQAGIPTAMIFIRNRHGSHHPKEEMTIEDFSSAATILTDYLANHA